MNGYKLLDGWEPNVDIEVEVKYVVLIFYFDIFDIENFKVISLNGYYETCWFICDWGIVDINLIWSVWKNFDI